MCGTVISRIWAMSRLASMEEASSVDSYWLSQPTAGGSDA